MKHYIGVKHIKAEPQEKDGKAGYKVVYDDGYESWSPKEAFEKAYFETTDRVSNAIESNVPDYIYRMYIEGGELEERICKLGKFIESEKFDGLTEIQRHYLIIQLNAMKTYEEVLCARIVNERSLQKVC